MKLTTRGRYAVTAMLDLAMRHGCGPVALADIARRHRISPAYLEQLLAGLRREGLVSGTRGPGGGYCLARAPEDISVACVISAVDETVDATRCGGTRDCHDGSRCLTHDLWEDLTRHIHDYLDGITLAGLCARAKRSPQACSVIPLRDMASSRSTSVLVK